MRKNEPAAMNEARTVTLERVFRAPVEKVRGMWTTKQGLAKWYWPEPLVAKVVSLDLRVGGGFEIAAEGLSHTSRSTFTEIVPPRRLVMLARIDFIADTPPYDRTDVLELHPVPEGTRMTFTSTELHDPHWQRMSELGWNGSFDKLARALEALG
jgi:uncharacterized protein YndB with AHSA1/START domain